MANTDFRVSCSFPGHRKTQKLKRRVGMQGIASLVFLWSQVAQNRPSGNLHGWTNEDIAIASQWDGNPDEFVSALIDIGFMDVNEAGEMVIHEWAVHNGYASNAEMRSEAAKKNAEARWNKSPKQRQCNGNATAMQRHSDLNATAMQGQCNGNAPIPIPIPIPIPKNIKDISTPPDGEKQKIDSCPHEEIIKLYHELLPELSPVRVWNEDSRKQLRARWKEAQERQDLKWWRSFFTEVRSCPFLMGQNNDGWKAALGWLILPKNLAKVVNGFYQNRANSTTTKPQNPNQPRQQTVNGKPCNSAYGYTWGETKDDIPPIAPPPGMKWEKIIEPYDGCSLGYKAVPC